MDIDNLKDLMGRVTPGPWRLDGPVWNNIVRTDSETRVCFMAHSNGLNDDRDIANAALIAMAPDLAAEVIRLTAEHAQLVAANQALATENARLVKRDAEARRTLDKADSALTEAEAILGGEYGDHYGPFCEMMEDLREAARAFLAGDGK